mmetsp:Transcript_9186/g.32505  ORF Transcript_9186/g.32505 Transcript_9186/m.32505 type:complete len:96 (+) Transcript_9186:549-836(+)
MTGVQEGIEIVHLHPMEQAVCNFSVPLPRSLWAASTCAPGQYGCSDLLVSWPHLLEFPETTLYFDYGSNGCSSAMENNPTTFSNWSSYFQHLGCQ